MKIRIKDIDATPCDKYLCYILDKYGEDGEFDPIEVFENVPGGAHFGDVYWLMCKCESAQTEEMIEYYKGLKPEYDDVRLLIHECEYTQTPEMLEYYKELNPAFGDVSYLIQYCGFAQTTEMLEYYMSLEPDDDDVSWLIRNCRFALENEHLLKQEGKK